MHDKIIRHQLDREVERLSDKEMAQLIEFARSLGGGTPRGEKGATLITRLPDFSAKDVKEIAEAIEAGCEQVDPDGW